MKQFVFCVMFLACTQEVHAATYYVDANNGSNANTCQQAQTVATAKKSMGNYNGLGGIQCLQPGDTMVVRAGTYPEAVYIGSQPYPGLQQSNPPVPNGTDDAHRTTIKGFPGDPHPVITGQDPDNGGVPTIGAQFITYDGIDIDGAGFNASGLGGQGVNSATFQNFEIKNQAFSAIQMFEGSVDFAHVHFLNIKIHDGPTMCTGSPTSHAYYIGAVSGVSTDIVIDHNEIYNWNVPPGTACNNGFVIQIYRSGGSNVMTNYQVTNNYIHDNTQSAGAIGTGSNYLIANNVVARNGSASVDVVGGFDIGFNTTTNPLIANNTFVGNAGYATGNGGFGIINGARFSNNIFWQNGNNDQISPDFNGTFMHSDDHNLQAIDPMFVNAAGNDFHLTSGSQAIGAGADLSAFFLTDKDGKTRTLPFDIGAFSFNGVVSNNPHITTASLPAGVVGTAYSTTAMATAGTPPYTWAISGLPAGLTATVGGVISGTPTTAGTSNVTLLVTDAASKTDSKTLPLVVNMVGGNNTLTLSVNSGPCTLMGTLTIQIAGMSWSFPGITVSASNPPSTCTLKIHDNSPTNPAVDLISSPFTVTAVIGTVPVLHWTQRSLR